MAAASPSILATVISEGSTAAQAISEKLTKLSERLTDKSEALTSAYAYDHSEEELLWSADALEQLAKSLRNLSAYTPTGEKRLVHHGA